MSRFADLFMLSSILSRRIIFRVNNPRMLSWKELFVKLLSSILHFLA
jgi:hypothetical protein